MKETWLYKRLKHLHQNVSFFEGKCESSFLENLANIIVIPILAFFALILALLSSLLLPLFLLKDLYDLYYYLNAEKIAKKKAIRKAIRKALKLKNDIKNWIINYQKRLNNNSTYILEKIIYEKKPKVEQLPGVNVGYLSNIEYGRIHIGLPNRHYNINCYPKHNIILKKELLTKEFIYSKHTNYKDFIIEFFQDYNNNCNTVNKDIKHICDTNRRRSLHDIYLITKYYYPEITFIDIIKTIISLLEKGMICGSYCSTVNKYVFYTPNISPYNNFNHTLEFTSELTFNDLKKYIENEQ